MNRVKEIVHAKNVYQNGYTGNGITIVLLDTGMAPHPDLINRKIQFLDWVNGRTYMYDDNGHGTHVAGILCGDGLRSHGAVKGMAPKSNLIIHKVLDYNGNGDTEDVLKALDWVLNNYKIYHINLLNFSVGFLPGADFTEQKRLLSAIEELWDCGVMVITAAGNNGPKLSTITVPGISRKVLTVGASDDYVVRGAVIHQGYSGKGPTRCCIVKPEVLAPGTNILSCDNKSDGYVYKSGTSMAAPIVCGALALAMEKEKTLRPEDWKLRLYETVSPMNEWSANKTWGLLHVDNLMGMH